MEDVSSMGEEVSVWGRWGNVGESVWGRWRQYEEEGCSMAEMWQYGGDEGIWGRRAVWGRWRQYVEYGSSMVKRRERGGQHRARNAL